MKYITDSEAVTQLAPWLPLAGLSTKFRVKINKKQGEFFYENAHPQRPDFESDR